MTESEPKSRGGVLLRLLTGLVLIAVFMTLVWLPPLEPVFFVVVAFFVLQGLREFCALAHAAGALAETACALAAAVVLMVGVYVMGQVFLLPALCLAAMALCGVRTIRGRPSIAGMAVSVFAVVYVAGFGAHLVLLHRLPDTGPALVTLLLVCVALSDTGAYTVGSLFGKHKMAPVLSPNKTWEGAVGGLACTVGGTACFYTLRDCTTWGIWPDWSLLRYVVTGAVLSTAAQMGDLTESAFKRDAGVKDSGHIIPGHGGVLDRCDGYLFTVPVLYYLVLYV